MKGKICMPEDFDLLHNDEYDDNMFIWNLHGEINDHVKDTIYMKPLYSHVLFEDNFGVVWWNDTIGYWCGYNMENVNEVGSYICETLEELQAEMLADS